MTTTSSSSTRRATTSLSPSCSSQQTRFCIFFDLIYCVYNQIDTNVVDERYSDRLMVIPWAPREVTDPQTLQAKANEYTAFVSQEAKPTEYTIGEMGDHLRRFLQNNFHQFNFSSSPEFMELRGQFVEELRPKTIVIKERTLRNNYASALAVRKAYHRQTLSLR